jgi:polyisoprenoid-binding protein YceI
MTGPEEPHRAAEIAEGRWRLDPERSSVEFRVRHFYGLMTVKGRFDRYRGTLDLSRRPAIELVAETASLDTGNQRRDEHLRSADFVDARHHPHVRFASETAVLDGDVLKVHGGLHAAGHEIPLRIDAHLFPADDGFRIDAEAEADHRHLGMTWSPLGILRSPSRLIVQGRLVRDDGGGQGGSEGGERSVPAPAVT